MQIIPLSERPGLLRPVTLLVQNICQKIIICKKDEYYYGLYILEFTHWMIMESTIKINNNKSEILSEQIRVGAGIGVLLAIQKASG